MVKMKKQTKKNLTFSLVSLSAFVLWTVAVSFIDVKSIGPQNSSVGFASLNSLVHNLTGVNFTLYTITDWLGLVPVAVCIGFGILGLYQLIRRKSILKVDGDIISLGVFYIAVIGMYILFENIVINYRPVLIEGFLEASYPSSTTMLVICVMSSSIIQIKKRITNKTLKNIVVFLCLTFTVFMVIGRLLSGVHWVTDIIGGALLSAGLVGIYYSVINLKN
jgi:undecaprenyl-diphosphatase